ncbi:MAG: transporter permease [Nocardioides sp.]|uniref:ABC transporter permease n=1 Tax=Nocardioides sp. TaxID=35761 RepID=UPI00262CBFBB|nr:ABC transporter permease [Nocardioides sp.]MCW2835382.1 transporter permease [Nocardioides sp.]
MTAPAVNPAVDPAVNPALDRLPSIDVSSTQQVPFGRLVSVELRKMTDTRAGRWLLAITLGVLIVAAGIVVIISLFDEQFSMTLSDWQSMLTFLTTLLLPTLAIMSVTQEWSQRTGLVTFALEPHRLRVILAKLAAVTLLALITLALAAVIGVAGHALLAATGVDISWTADGKDLAWTLYLQMVYFLMAFGLAMAILNTPGSIVAYYVVALILPNIVYGAVYFLLSWGPDVVPWVDLGFAVAAFRGELPPVPSGTPDLGVGPVLSTLTIWVVLPMAIGLRRILRTELK